MFDICLLISFCINTIYIWYLSHLEANDQLLHLKRFSVLVPECMDVISLIMQRLNEVDQFIFYVSHLSAKYFSH